MADTEGVPIDQVVKRLVDSANAVFGDNLEEIVSALFEPKPEPEEYVPRSINLPHKFFELASSTSRAAEPFNNYASKRGWDEAFLQESNARFCISYINELPKKHRGSFRNRIIFPVYDFDGICRSAVARDITGKKERPRWVNYPDSDPAHYFWPMGIWLPVESLSSYYPVSIPRVVALTEGIIDAHALGRYGRGAYPLACFGKKVSDQQINLLREAGVEIVILAWDLEAKDKMAKAAEHLSCSFEVRLYPYIHPAWREFDLDFGDALLPKSPLREQIAEEMQQTVRFDSLEFISWLAR
jgi:hypothetical protein